MVDFAAFDRWISQGFYTLTLVEVDKRSDAAITSGLFRCEVKDSIGLLDDQTPLMWVFLVVDCGHRRLLFVAQVLLGPDRVTMLGHYVAAPFINCHCLLVSVVRWLGIE